MSENKLGVALTREVCFICGEEQEGPVVINTTLTEKAAKEVEALNNTVIGYVGDNCDSCKEHLKMGGIVVLIDEEKSTSEAFYRTGEMIVLKKEVFDEIVSIAPDTKPWEDDVLFMAKDAWAELTEGI